jgi:hypothetical protein
MRTKNKTVGALFCFLLAALSVGDAFVTVVSLFIPPAFAQAPAKDGGLHWTQTLAQKNSPYPVLDSGVWADWLNSPNMYWLDDQRLIFLGTETKDKPINREKLQIQIWDISNNKVTPYASTNGGIIGYNDGVIAYLYGKDSSGNNVFKCGKLNNEKVFTLVRKSKTYFDSINCRIQNSEEEPGRKERRTIRPLLKQHGYLDYGPRDAVRPLAKKGDPILFYPAGKKEPVSLPITNETTVIRMFDYYMFKDAYFVHHFTGYQDAWWMYPNGQTERVTFSELPKLLSQGKFFPIRNGFFVSRGSGKIDPGKDPGDAGGYLLRDTRILELISGYLRAEAVSPDGCKIAFVNYPYIDATRLDDPARVALKAINFCMEEK